MGTQLVKYDAMCQAIAACHKVDEVKDIRDKALALEAYARQAMNMEAERKACEVRLRAERRAGELIPEMKKKGLLHTGHGDQKSESADMIPKLEDYGISRNQSYKWQALAEVPKNVFEAALRDPEKKPSTNGIIGRPTPAMDEDALWMWGRLRDFERLEIAKRSASEIFGEMTDTMQDDMRRICPSIIAWLTDLGEL